MSLRARLGFDRTIRDRTIILRGLGNCASTFALRDYGGRVARRGDGFRGREGGWQMPVECPLELVEVGRDEYHRLDYRVMGIAFEAHRDMGRLHDEAIYQAEVAHRCRDAGFDAQCEVPIKVRHRDFVKTYFLDLVVDRRIIYELKTVKALAAEHRAQLLHYLMLLGAFCGKLVNFRPKSVESEFVTTTLPMRERCRASIDASRFQSCEASDDRLHAVMADLLEDWGAYLDVRLYSEAITHFLQGPDGGPAAVDVICDGRVLGQRRIRLINDDTAFQVTALKTGLDSYQHHLTQFLNHTPLSRLQWLNLDGRNVSFTTINQQ